MKAKLFIRFIGASNQDDFMQCIELDTDGGPQQSKYWSWNYPGDTPIAYALSGNSVYGVSGSQSETSNQNYVIENIFRGFAGSSPLRVTPNSLPGSINAGKAVRESPDGRYIVGYEQDNNRIVSFDFSQENPAPVFQAVGSFPFAAEIGLMSFEDGSSRLVGIDNQGVSHLSTVVGGTGAITSEVQSAMPVLLPPNLDLMSFMALGAIAVGRLAKKAKDDLMISPVSFHSWILAKVPDGSVFSMTGSSQLGLGLPPDEGGIYRAGYFFSDYPASYIEEYAFKEDYSFESLSRASIEQTPGSGSVEYAQFELTPSMPKVGFWTKLVRSFEQIEPA